MGSSSSLFWCLFLLVLSLLNVLTPSQTFSLLPAQGSLQIFPAESSLFWGFPDVQSPRWWPAGEQVAGPGPARAANSDSTGESQRLPQFSDSHNRPPLGTSSSEPSRLPEIVIPALASTMSTMSLQRSSGVAGNSFILGPSSLPFQVARMKMQFWLPSRGVILIQQAAGHCLLIPKSLTATLSRKL